MTAMAISTAVSSGRIELSNERQRSLLLARWRMLWVVGLFSLIALIVVLRIGFVGLVKAAPVRQDLASALLPERGDIVDRNGQPLARAFPAYALWYNPAALGGDGPPLVRSPKEVAAALGRIFPNEDQARLTERLAAGKPGYLRRRILPEDANRIHALGEPALEFPREIERFYPQGSMASHVLGYVGADGAGRVGMEQVFNRQLTDPATRGQPATLALDIRVQGALEDELLRGMRESNAKGGAGIVLDVDTGEVVALASLPSFNPNLIDQIGAGNIFNRMTNQVYELGSTFKPITVAAALDAGTVTNLGRRYQAARPIAIGGFQIRDSHALGASLNVPESLIHSSNIVTAQIGDELGSARLNATMRALGMNERPYIELPAKGFPLWPKGEWSQITTMTVSYGHGIAVTPLHLASAYAALVNGGIWRPATLKRVQPGSLRTRSPRVQGLDQGADAAIAADDRQHRYGQERQCRWLPRRWKNRLGGKARRGRISAHVAGRDLCCGVSDGPPALCDHRHAGRAARHRCDFRTTHRRMECCAGGRAGCAPDRAAAGDHARRYPRRRYL